MDLLTFISNLLAAGVARGTPILFATLGEIVTERAGVLNLGIEGMMLLGAMSGYGISYMTGNPWLGLIAGCLAGGLLSLLHAFVSVTLRGDQVVAGLALTFLGSGLASVLGAPLIEVRETAARLNVLELPLLSKIPLLGPVLFQQNIIVYIGFIIVPVIWIYLFRTRPGLHLRAVGEQPAAAAARGISVAKTRYLYVFAGGFMAGLGGASLSLAVTPGWIDGMTAGQGWIAIGLVIFAGWNPWRAALGSYLFGAIRRLPLDLQGQPWIEFFHNPSTGYFLNMLPYIFTITVLLLSSRKSFRRKIGAPEALGKPYTPGEKYR